jgi:hypothetical protein
MDRISAAARRVLAAAGQTGHVPGEDGLRRADMWRKHNEFYPTQSLKADSVSNYLDGQLHDVGLYNCVGPERTSKLPGKVGLGKQVKLTVRRLAGRGSGAADAPAAAQALGVQMAAQWLADYPPGQAAPGGGAAAVRAATRCAHQGWRVRPEGAPRRVLPLLLSLLRLRRPLSLHRRCPRQWCLRPRRRSGTPSR